MSPVVFQKSGIHGYGCYAATDVAKGKALIQYVGTVHSTGSVRESDSAFYSFTLTAKWDMDGNVPWNPARHINHSCEPNAHSLSVNNRFVYPDYRGAQITINRQVWIVANRDIKKGEEITYNYQVPFDTEVTPKLVCACGSAKCVGYIVSEADLPKLERWKKLALDG